MDNEYINKMIRPDGTKRYAYVTLLMIDETYAPGSIVLSESIKKLGSLSDLVIMIDNTITKETEEMLKNFYDKIIKIDKIEINHEDNTQKYILSKLESLKMVEYDKIIIIDIDSIIIKKPDNSFNLETPGLIQNENNKKYYYSSYILIKPDKDKYEEIIKKISTTEMLNKLYKEKKPLSYILTKFYDNINKLDNKLLRANNYEESNGIQYTVNKPFIIKSKIPIEERIHWEHFKLWYLYFRDILNKYPKIREYKCLEETIEFSKYFLSILSKYRVEKKKLNKYKDKETSKMYLLDKNKKTNKDYYHLNISKEYDNENINYILKDKAYINFIDYLKRKTNLFEDKLLITPNNLIPNIQLDVRNLLNNLQDEIILDYFLSEYSRLHTNVFIVLMVNQTIDEKIILTDHMQQNLLYKRDLKIMGMILKNILFNINQNYVYDQRIGELAMYSDYTFYTVSILFYETLYPIELDNTNKKIYILNDTNSKIRASSIFLNRNTLNKFTKKKILFYKNNRINKNQLIDLIEFQTLKKWLYNNYTGDELNNIIIVDKSPLTIIDNNKHNISEIKILLERKIDRTTVLFSKSPEYKDLIKKYNKIIENINNPKYYWELEGIKYIKN